MKIKRAVIYGRTSLDKSDGRSVDDQLAELRRWAEREGVQVVGEFRDDGISASRFAKSKPRPGWQAVIELVSAGKVDAVAVWEVSRASRDRAVFVALLAALTEAKAVLVVGGKVHDPCDPDGGFMLDLSAALAVRESSVTSRRTLRAVDSRAASGRPHGKLNYGYRIEHDVDTGKAVRRVLDPVQAPVVREIAERLLAGESASGIARDLNTRGILALRGGLWRHGDITSMIGRPALAGLRVHRGEVLGDASWEPILTVEEHHRLVALLADPSRRPRRTGAHVRHLLVGVGECGVCGAKLAAVTYRRKDGRKVFYRCRENYCVSRDAEPVDAMVELAMVRYLSRPDLSEALAAQDPETKLAAARATELRAELARARAAYKARKFSLDGLLAVEQANLPEIEKLDEMTRPRHVPTVLFDVAGVEAAARWAATPVAARREIVAALLRVRIEPTARRNAGMPFDWSSVRIEPVHGAHSAP